MQNCENAYIPNRKRRIPAQKRYVAETWRRSILDHSGDYAAVTA